MTKASEILNDILAVCPVEGVAPGRIDFLPEATAPQRAAAQAIHDAWMLETPAQRMISRNDAPVAILRTAFTSARAEAVGIMAELNSPTFLTITAIERNDLYRRALLALFRAVVYIARKVEGD